MVSRDTVSGVVAMLAGIGLIYFSSGLPTVKHIDFGPGFLPSLTGGGMAIAGALLVLSSILSPAKHDDEAEDTGGTLLNTLPVIGAILFYILTVEWLGFLLCTFAVLCALFWWFHRKAAVAFATAVAVTLVLHSFFYQIMHVQLPWGVLERYAGVLTW